MALLPFLRKKDFFNQEEKDQILAAIRNAEIRTSGEIRIFVESRCRYVDPIDRAAELFFGLKMNETEQRNAVLVYIALKDHQLAIFGDQGIYEKTGQEFWNKEVSQMLRQFNRQNYVDGLVQVTTEIGEALQKHFPFDQTTDKNELPDDIVFGK